MKTANLPWALYVINYGTKGTYKDGGSRPRRKQYGDSSGTVDCDYRPS